MATVDLKFEVLVECGDCGQSLDVFTAERGAKILLLVKPCERCEEKAEARGREQS